MRSLGASESRSKGVSLQGSGLILTLGGGTSITGFAENTYRCKEFKCT